MRLHQHIEQIKAQEIRDPLFSNAESDAEHILFILYTNKVDHLGCVL